MNRTSAEPSSTWSPWLRLLQLARWFVIRIPDPLRLHLAFRLRLPLGKGSFVVTTTEGFRFVVWDLFEIVQRYVFWTGTWEHEEAIVVQQIPTGGTVVDVGAQLGYFSLSASNAVGPNGRVNANILAKNVTIGGTLDGNIQASERTEMRKTALVNGDVQTRRIAIEEGAYFKGRLEILNEGKLQAAAGD